jgi:hypothetical protein
MKQPDPKLHQQISFAKSCVRIISCMVGILGMPIFAFGGLALAEVIGIYEELV